MRLARYKAIAVLVVLILGLASFLYGQSEVSSLENAILFVQTSARSDSPETHFGSYGIENGWGFVVERHIQPYLDWKQANFPDSKARVFLQLPFGRRVSEDQQAMHLYGVTDAEEAGLHHFYEDFVDSIRPITDDGHEVIAYIGSPHNTRDLISHRFNGRFDRVVVDSARNVEVALEAGCSLGFDNIAGINRPAFSRSFVWWLQDLGVKVYVEATPVFGDRDWDRLRSMPAVVSHKTFFDRHGRLVDGEFVQHRGAVGRFPRVDQDSWYMNEVIVTCSRIREADSALLMAERLGEYPVDLSPAFTIATWKKIIRQWPVDGADLGSESLQAGSVFARAIDWPQPLSQSKRVQLPQSPACFFYKD